MPEPSASTTDAFIRDALARHEGPLLRYAMRLLNGDLNRARDVVQDIFLRLTRQPREKVADHLVEWLFTVCRNRALEIKRKETRMQPLNDARLAAAASSTPDPASAAARRDDVSRLLQIVGTLPDRQQELIRLKFQNELSYKEISRITALSVSNVGVILHNAVKNIRQAMQAPPSAAPKES